MSIAYFLEVHCDSGEISRQQLNSLFSVLPTLPHITGINVYTPAPGGHDPLLPEEHAPKLVVQLKLLSTECLERMLRSDELKNIHATLEALPLKNLKLTQEAMELETFLQPDDIPVNTISYLVSYHRPNTDEAHFIQHYRANHVPIMLRFPELLRLELAYRTEWKTESDIVSADKILYCEVNFSSLEKLNAALASDIRTELRKDYQSFPPIDGAVTHFPMTKQILM